MGSLLKAIVRDIYRLLTYSPSSIARERRSLMSAMASWKGEHLFVFPYLGLGGAERVHLDILATIDDQDPLVLITGFSKDRINAARFEEAGRMVEIPHLVNHPFTRKRALRAISGQLNKRSNPVLFGSLSAVFFELLPFMKKGTRAYWLQHAFLFQPEGNKQHKAWLKHIDRVTGYLFVARQAAAEFAKFLRDQGSGNASADKLIHMPNAVARFGEVRTHSHISVLFVGRDSEEKRLGLFLHLAETINAGAPDRFRFTVVGPAARPDRPGLTFLGPICAPEQLDRIYAQHDLLCVTSSREGFPMVIMEAMAQGLSVLSTPVGDVPLVLDQTNAFVTSSVDEAVVVQEMETFLLRMNDAPEILLQMRTAALDLARTAFAQGPFRDRYRGLLLGTDRSM